MFVGRGEVVPGLDSFFAEEGAGEACCCDLVKSSAFSNEKKVFIPLKDVLNNENFSKSGIFS